MDQNTPTDQSPTTPPSAQQPAIGTIVHFVLDNGDYYGEHRPAVVVKLATDNDGLERVHLQVWTLGPDEFRYGQPGYTGTLYRSDVRFDDAKNPNSWHWIEA